ncbi:MAG: sulfotransferase family 2 domain-containing protein [Ruegeria sp.]
MTAKFDYFIIFAEMRTGSNFLESNLNAMDGLSCFGEAFNPHFIGYPNRDEILGLTKDQRNADPARLIDAIRNTPDELGGFRFFHDHDSRVLEIALADPRCAKIILTRNPLDSYVSWKIAQQTGQWKLTNVKRRKEAKAQFDGDEFLSHVDTLQRFQIFLLNALQRSGQTAFYVSYEDLQSVDIMNGLAKWLGSDAQLKSLDQSLKRQNPSPTSAKVANVEDMSRALSALDPFNLTRTPNFEPRRGPAVPSYVAGATTPLMYLPIRGGPEDEITQWLADLDGVSTDALTTGMNQKQTRQWMRKHPGHRRFTVLRHPLARAHTTFCRRILNTGPGSLPKIRNTLRRQFKVNIPPEAPDKRYSLSRHREAFTAFLEFLRLNLAGQTPIRVDSSWSTQAQLLSGFADFALPDLVFREDEAADALPDLARKLGHPDPHPLNLSPADSPFALSDIHDARLEELAHDIYQRDFLMFGFGPWRPL